MICGAQKRTSNFLYFYLITDTNFDLKLKAVPKAVLIWAPYQGDFVAGCQNWALTVPMPEVCYGDQAGFRCTSYEGLGPDCVISKHHGPKSKPKHTFYRFSWNAFPLHTHRATVLHVEQ